MSLMTKLGKAVRNPGRALEVISAEWRNLNWRHYYNRLPEPKVIGPVPHNRESTHSLVTSQLTGNGFDVVNYSIDMDDFRRHCARARYEKYPNYTSRSIYHAEKMLEHYLAAKLIGLSPDDVYIDIANAGSPTPEIYRELFGCKVYRQDLIYPHGLHGDTIGGDAGAMPLPDGFATKMALHCSFEHFEGDADSRFIKEVSRVLRPGGRACIAPLYLFDHFAVQTDPVVIPAEMTFDEGATIYAARGWRNRHGRCYDVPHLVSRVQDHLSGLKLTIYSVTNVREIHSSCYLKFVAVLER